MFLLNLLIVIIGILYLIVLKRQIQTFINHFNEELLVNDHENSIDHYY